MEGPMVPKSTDWGYLPSLVLSGAYTAVGYNTKSKMIDNMQACAPQLDRNFCGQLIDFITGTDPDTHMLRLYPDGTYDTIDIG